jgi:tetratricopeptide (TPR) repeat protein
VLFASGASHHLWTDFKRPQPPASAGNGYFRLFSLAGSHRYQYWHVALDAYRAHKLHGIGPGTFDLYWAQHQTLGEFVRNAHSLYIEVLAELGLVGFVLILGLVLSVLAGGAIRSFRVPERAVVAAATAGFAGFAAAAFFDWVWQIGVIPIVGMLLAAAALAGSEPARRRALSPVRVAIVAGAIVGLVAIIRPLGVAVQVRASQKSAQAGHLQTALDDAESAQAFEPTAASPRLQQALVLEEQGDVPGARRAIAAAQQREPTNWQTWLIGSRIAVEAGRPSEALSDYRRARSLNRKSTIFP